MTKKKLGKIKRSVTRRQVLAEVKKQGLTLKNFDMVFKKDEEIKKDKEIILTAVSSWGTALEYADKSLKKDKEVVLAAVKNEGWALQYADKSLRKDKKIVLAAIQEDGGALQFADKSFRKDRKIVLAAVKSEGYALQYADKSFRKDKKIVLAAMQENGYALQYADKSLRKDKKIVLAAIQSAGIAIQFADKSLRRDKEFVLNEIEKDLHRASQTREPWSTFFHIEDFLKKDKEFVLDAIQRNGSVLLWADKSFRADRKFVLAAVQRNGFALIDAYARFRKNKKIVLSAVQNNPNIFDPLFFKYIDKSLQKNPDILKYKNYKRIVYSNGDVYVGKVKNSQRNGRGKYLFGSGSEFVGVWKNGDLHNGMGRIERKGEYDYPEIFINKYEEGKILYNCGQYNNYQYFIRSQRQFNHLIKNFFLKTDELIWKKLWNIQFLESSIPAIFNSKFHKIATIGTLPFHMDFMGFKPTPQYNKYFLKLMKNINDFGGDKRDFAHMPNLYFNNVKLTSQKVIVLASEFFKTFLSDIYGGGTVYNVLETAYGLHSRNTWPDPKYKGSKPRPKPRKGFDSTNIKQRKEVEKFYLPNGDGEFTLTINGKVAFDSIGFSKNFDYKKLYEIYELEDQKKFKREIKNYFNNFFKKLNFTKYFKAKKVNTIHFVVESMDEDFRSAGFDTGGDWDINEEWEKINSL